MGSDGSIGCAVCASFFFREWSPTIAMPGDTSASSLLARPPPIPKSGRSPSRDQPGQVAAPTTNACSHSPDNPQTAEKTRSGRALLRRAGCRSTNRAAHLPRSPARVHRRPADLHRGTGRRGQAQLADGVERANTTDAVLDGRAKTLEDQAALPITNPWRWGSGPRGRGRALAASPSTSRPFGGVRPPPETRRTWFRAAASYESTLTSFIRHSTVPRRGR